MKNKCNGITNGHVSSSQSSSTSEPGSGSSTGEEFPGLSVLQKYLPQVPAVAPVQHMMTNEMKLADLVERTGYQIVQRNGQRIYGGPPPNYIGKAPCKGTEVFVGKIPRDMFEYDLVPLFERCGRIYEMRLMMDFSGSNR